MTVRAGFGAWAATNAKPLTGDFNKDGKTDIALAGVPGLTTMPIAFSNFTAGSSNSGVTGGSVGGGFAA